MTNRHNNHKEGETLYFMCRDTKQYRPGIVKQRIHHTSMIYYVLEVEIPILGESVLELVSEFMVKTKEELA